MHKKVKPYLSMINIHRWIALPLYIYIPIQAIITMSIAVKFSWAQCSNMQVIGQPIEMQIKLYGD